MQLHFLAPSFVLLSLRLFLPCFKSPVTVTTLSRSSVCSENGLKKAMASVLNACVSFPARHFFLWILVFIWSDFPEAQRTSFSFPSRAVCWQHRLTIFVYQKMRLFLQPHLRDVSLDVDSVLTSLCSSFHSFTTLLRYF